MISYKLSSNIEEQYVSVLVVLHDIYATGGVVLGCGPVRIGRGRDRSISSYSY